MCVFLNFLVRIFFSILTQSEVLFIGSPNVFLFLLFIIVNKNSTSLSSYPKAMYHLEIVLPHIIAPLQH